jgi:hypothetical protein
MAVVLLIGVVLIAIGYYGQSKLALYLGLFVVVAGTITGIVRVVM